MKMSMNLYLVFGLKVEKGWKSRIFYILQENMFNFTLKVLPILKSFNSCSDKKTRNFETQF